MTVNSDHQQTIQQAGFAPACLLSVLLSVMPALASTDSLSNKAATDTNHRPLASLGRLSILQRYTALDVGKQRIRQVDYQGLSELLARATGAFPRSMGGFGQHNTVSLYGEDPASHAYALNGRALVDPWSQRFHLEQWSVEGFERLELLHGTDALGLGAGMALHAINMQQIIYNTRTPITRLWYAQGGGEWIAGDVSLAQNVARNVNVWTGIRRSGAIGRFDQTGFDVWNVRAGVRWTPHRMLHTALTYDLSSMNTDLWGGVRGDVLSAITEPTATPVFAALRDLSRRHDVQLTAAYILREDSSAVLHGSVYGTRAALIRHRDTVTTFLLDSIGTGDTVTSTTVGVNARLEQRLGALFFSTGASIDAVNMPISAVASAIDDMRVQAWTHVRWQLSPSVNLRAAARLLLQDASMNLGAGVTAEWTPTTTSSYAVDVSTAPRMPGPTERLIIMTSPSPERHLLARAIADHRFKDGSMRIEGFYRRISDPITMRTSARDAVPYASNATTVNIAGAVLTGGLHWRQLEFNSVARLMIQSAEDDSPTAMPVAYGNVTVAYRYETASNAVRFGVTIAALTSMSGPGYSPITWTFTNGDVRQAATTNGIDGHVTATVGNAVVRAALENILGVPWFSVAGYPQISRNFRLSVHWSFFD